MLIKILLSRKAFASMSLAVGMRTVDSVLRAAVLAVNLPLMSEEAARVCKARKIFTSFSRAAIRAFVLVHVLAAGCIRLALNLADGGEEGGGWGKPTSIRICGRMHELPPYSHLEDNEISHPTSCELYALA